MKKPILILSLLTFITLSAFAQQEVPLFFDSELGSSTPMYTIFFRRVAYSPDGGRIAASFDNKRIAIWDAATGRLITKLAGHNDAIGSIAFSPNGRQLLSCSGRDSTIRIWDAASGALVRTIQEQSNFVSFSPDGSRIVGTIPNNRVRYGMPQTAVRYERLNIQRVSTLLPTALTADRY